MTLASWNDTATREAIVAFAEGAAQTVPPEERVAVFDNDGTLWSEKPMPIELGFILERLATMAEKDASLAEKQPWKAAHEKDYAWLGGVIDKHYAGDDSDVKVLIGGILQAFAGQTVEEYVDAAAAFLDVAPHPSLGRRLRDTGYAPMVELLRYLEAHGFTCFIASGGSRDFMRSVTGEIYGIPSHRVIGSSNGLEYTDDEHGGALAYLAQPDVFDDGPVKRCGSGAGSGGGRSSPQATPTATSRCSASRAAKAGRRCGCSSSTTTPTASSTTSRAPSARSSRRARTDGRSSA